MGTNTTYGSTARSRELGRRVRHAVSRTDRDLTHLAEALDGSPADLHLLLRGRHVPDSPDLAALLAMCGIVGTRRDELLELAGRAHERTWWHDHGTYVPIQRPALTTHEEAATMITGYHPCLLPDLARTAGYTRALLRVLPVLPRREIEDRVAETLRRQRVLHRPDPPTYRVFVDEYAITRTGAGHEVMVEQARHLLHLADRDHVHVRIVSEAGAVHDHTPFELLEFADLPPVTYVEHVTATAFLERPDTVAAYRRVVAELDRVALDDAASRDRLASLAS